MPTLYLLIGIPGSGKTTWAKTHDFPNDIAHISSDYFVEEYADLHSTTYTNVFKEYAPTATRLMFEEAVEAKNLGLDIVWDQTNTTVSTRKKKLVLLADYIKIAVVFKPPKDDELKERLASRPGKVIPDDVIKDMIEKFQDPTKGEGFDEVWFVT